MADIKSLETLLAELKTFLRAYNRRLDTGDNSLAKDLLLLPYSVGGKAIMDQVEIARDLGILSRLETDDLDNEGTNYTRERLTGTYATVALTFFTETDPTSTITIPAGTQVQTAGTAFVSPVTFSTVAQATFAVADISSYFSFDRNRYEFEVTAICDTIGTDGNISANLITRIVGSITGIDGVSNLVASTGGLDAEIDDDFRERIKLAKTGRDLNTVNGLRSYIMDAGFVDGYPVRVEDADSERATGIDVFVITNTSAAYTETFTYDPGQARYYFTKRPVLEVTSVSAGGSTLAASVYDVQLDNASPMRRSIYSNDYIRILAGASLVVGQSFTVVYNYASLIEQVQATLNENENDILTADPLIKRAYPLYLYVSASLTLKANADGPTTRNRCRNALAQWAAAYRLGDDIQKSDLTVVLQQGYGDYNLDTVDSVIISNYYLQGEDSVIYQAVDEVISVENKQYVVYGSATII